MEELNRRIAETANSSTLLVSLDTRWFSYAAVFVFLCILHYQNPTSYTRRHN